MTKYFIPKRFLVSTEYQRLLSQSLSFCKKIEVSIEGQPNYKILNSLKDHLISSELKDGKRILTYEYNKDTFEVIMGLTDNIYDWNEPSLPNNFNLLRDDNSVFLSYYDAMEVVIFPEVDEIKLIDSDLPNLFKEKSIKTPNTHQSSSRIKICDGIRTKKFDYLANDFVALAKNYIALAEETENEILSGYLVDDYDSIPNLGLKNELEIEKSLIQSNEIKENQKKELNIIIPELAKIDGDFSKFLVSNIDRSLAYLRLAVNTFLDYYPNIISISTAPNKDYWNIHLSNFQDARNDISAIVALADAISLGSVKKETEELKQYDRALINNLKINNFQIVHYQSGRYSKSYWWYHLHEIDKLSKKDLETI